MKKFLSIMLTIAIITVMFTGCGGNNTPGSNVIDPDFNNDVDINADTTAETPAQNSNVSREGFASSKEEFLEKIGKFVDISLYDIDDEDDDYVDMYLKSEIEQAYNFNYTINIGNDSIKLPVSFADMKNSAFSTDINEDYSVSNTIQSGVDYKTANGKEFTLWTTNLDALFDDTDVECEVKDCIFYEFEADVNTEEYDENDAVYYEKNDAAVDFDIHGITPDSTIEDVLETIKNPTYITYDKEDNTITIRYTEEIGNSNTTADNSSLTIHFFADQNFIEYIKYEYAPAAVK